MNKFKKITIGCVMASMLVGVSIASAAAQSFKDVDSSFWAASAIQWGVEQKITSGYEDGTFKPNKTVSEEEFLALLIRAFGDIPSSGNGKSWSDKYYDFAKKNNMPVTGKRSSMITRLSVAEIIVGTQGVNLTGDAAIQYMLDKGFSKGKTSPTVEGYKGEDTLSRAEAISFLKNIIGKVENKIILARPTTTPSDNKPSIPIQKSTVPVFAAGSFGGTFILTKDGELWSRGLVYGYDNKEFQVMQNVSSVFSGQAHYLVLKNDNTLWAWGMNRLGEVGDGTTKDKEAPVQILSGVKSISGGSEHSFAIMNDGTVKAWGNNSVGQLGDGTKENRSMPVTIPNLKNVVAITGEHNNSFALMQDGTVWAWGAINEKLSPEQLSGISDVVSISSGGNHTLALKKDGTVWAIGMNDKGQIGDGTNEYRFSFVQVLGLSNIIEISGGEDHSLALAQDGTVWAWGSNKVGQLGNGSKIDNQATPYEAVSDSEYKNRPIKVPNLSNVVKIGGHFHHSIAIDKEGNIWTWGYNFSGQLGDGTKNNQSVPVQFNKL